MEAYLRALARRAREHNVEAVCAAVLADPGESDVARCRAFYRVVTALAGCLPARSEPLGAIA